MNYKKLYKSQVETRLKVFQESPGILTEEDTQHLPVLIQKYLHFAGAVGKPKVINFRAVFNGRMKRKANSGWNKITAHQYNFCNEPARIFYIRSSMFGIPFEGLHIYSGETATMEIAVALLFKVVDARGEKMNHSETVTLFNDMCLLAPATLISANINWEPVDSSTVNAIFTNGNNKISAKLVFNSDGSLSDFISNDRYLSSDGKTFLSYPWSTPVKEFKSVGDRMVPSIAEAVWQMEESQYVYAEFNLKEIDFNCREFHS